MDCSLIQNIESKIFLFIYESILLTWELNDIQLIAKRQNQNDTLNLLQSQFYAAFVADFKLLNELLKLGTKKK